MINILEYYEITEFKMVSTLEYYDIIQIIRKKFRKV